VLDDLHWGDVPTVSFLDGALRALRDRPLVVIASAQPDVHRLFPRLWADRNLTEMALGELSREASETIVRHAFGDRALAEETLARVVERAAGNALYLEELVRSVAEGRDELPAHVLAMVQARLASLDPEARRVLRAASVFGATFWTDGVAALLEGADAAHDVDARLDELTQRELVAPRDGGRFAGEHVFRHGIVRDAAYGMLTDADRALGHRLGGDWLERAGESDAMAIADHLERGGEHARAARWYERAATQALEGNDLAAVVARVDQGIACGAQGELLGALHALRAEAHRWRGELDELESSLRRALALLPRGTAAWCDAASQLVEARVRRGSREALDGIVAELCDVQRRETAVEGGVVVAWARAATWLVFGAHHALAAPLFDRLDGAKPAEDDPIVVGRIGQAQATRAVAAGDLSAFVAHVEASVRAFETAGDLRSACVQRCNAGYARAMLGAYLDAEALLREALATADRAGLVAPAAVAHQNLGLTLAYRGALDEARAHELLAVETATASSEPVAATWSHAYLAEIHALAGDLEAAERSTRDALGTIGERQNDARTYALAVRARTLVAMGRADDALAAAREATERLAQVASFGVEAMVRLAHAEALHACGDRAGARDAIASARARLQERARAIGDVSMRASFLENVAANALTLRLASEWSA
jgi:tetratricopeptide (TPR) repeat protein